MDRYGGRARRDGVSIRPRDLNARAYSDAGPCGPAATEAVEPIREDRDYGGRRVKLEVRLGRARIDLQIDVGFGDASTPKAEYVAYPTLLGMEPPRHRASPQEALVTLGMANSRMKDFFDSAVLARSFAFSGPVLRDAIAATFQRRGTAVPTGLPIALTDSSAKDGAKLT
jgi:Nucleotidyl transferase AbiEii toxin, Type IV TA system